MTRRVSLVAACAVFASASSAAAQLSTPSSHWGAQMLPETQERTEVAVHFVGFTEYGKEVFPGTEEYTFTPYNDMDETLGFNLVSLMHYDVLDRASVTSNALSRRRTYTAGIIHDAIPEYLQNTVIHWARWRGRERLRRIPRDTVDTPESTSAGLKRLWPPVLSYTDEYFLRIPYLRRRNSKEERVPTPVFVGGGYTIGTLNQEAFLHAGTSMVEIQPPRPLRIGKAGRGVELRSVGLGGMARAGLVAPGIHFDDLTAGYTNVQGGLRLNVDWWAFPTQLDVTATVANGFFARSRTAEEWETIRELGPDTDHTRVYSAKTPVSERFVSLRVRIGEFTFETYNDMIGGKDKGPSFGVHLAYSINPFWPLVPRNVEDR